MAANAPASPFPFVHDALLISNGLDPMLYIQPVTPAAHAICARFASADTPPAGTIAIHADDFDAPDGLAAALEGVGLYIKP